MVTRQGAPQCGHHENRYRNQPATHRSRAGPAQGSNFLGAQLPGRPSAPLIQYSRQLGRPALARFRAAAINHSWTQAVKHGLESLPPGCSGTCLAHPAWQAAGHAERQARLEQ